MSRASKTIRLVPSRKLHRWVATKPTTPRRFKGHGEIPIYSTEFSFVRGSGKRAPCRGTKYTGACHIEFLLDEEGPAIRLCPKRKDEGVRVPVKDHTQATELALNYCKCAKATTPKGRSTCAMNTAKFRQTLKGARSSRRA